jgi:glycosyltransferase involved in cell wall biosynthesis
MRLSDGPRRLYPQTDDGRGGPAQSDGQAVLPPAAAQDLPRALAGQVSVVIPTLNEALNLWHVLPTLSSEYEVLIVDGGSTDGTREVALALRPDAVVLRQPGRGKGDALLCGFLAASGEIIVTFDADGSAKADEIPRFVEALQSGADFAKGSRFVAKGGSADLTRLRKLGNRFLCGIVNLLYRTPYTDLCYGFNAFWRECIPFMPQQAQGFEIETLMHIRTVKAGLDVVEVGSYEEPRRSGQSNLHAFRDGFSILRVILAERFISRRRAPVAEPAPIAIAAESTSAPALAREAL